jgi:hypothetical protein
MLKKANVLTVAFAKCHFEVSEFKNNYFIRSNKNFICKLVYYSEFPFLIIISIIKSVQHMKNNGWLSDFLSS